MLIGGSSPSESQRKSNICQYLEMAENTRDGGIYYQHKSEVIKNETLTTSVVKGDMETLNIIAELEQKLMNSEQKVKVLENQFALAKENAEKNARDKQEHIAWYEEQLRQALKFQENMEILEMESKWLKSELGSSQSKISQLETDMRKAYSQRDDLVITIQILQERETLLNEQLASVELKAKTAEERFILQTELLEKEIELKQQKDAELQTVKDLLNKQKLEISMLAEKVQDLENELKNFEDELDEDNQSDDHDEEHVKTIDEIEVHDDNLFKPADLSKSPNPNSEDMVASSAVCKNVTLNGEIECLSQTKEKAFSQDDIYQNQISHVDQRERSSDVFSENELATMQLTLENARHSEKELLSQVNSYVDQLTVQEHMIKQLSTRCAELEEYVDLQSNATDTKCAEAKSAFMQAVSEARKLEEKLMLFERIVKEAESQVAKEKEEKQKSSPGKFKNFARSISLPTREQEVQKLRKAKDKKKSYMDCIERIDEVASPNDSFDFHFNLRMIVLVAVISIIVEIGMGKF